MICRGGYGYDGEDLREAFGLRKSSSAFLRRLRVTAIRFLIEWKIQALLTNTLIKAQEDLRTPNASRSFT